jgi:hypothetical protein
MYKLRLGLLPAFLIALVTVPASAQENFVFPGSLCRSTNDSDDALRVSTSGSNGLINNATPRTVICPVTKTMGAITAEAAIWVSNTNATCQYWHYNYRNDGTGGWATDTTATNDGGAKRYDWAIGAGSSVDTEDEAVTIRCTLTGNATVYSYSYTGYEVIVVV